VKGKQGSELPACSLHATCCWCYAVACPAKADTCSWCCANVVCNTLCELLLTFCCGAFQEGKRVARNQLQLDCRSHRVAVHCHMSQARVEGVAAPAGPLALLTDERAMCCVIAVDAVAASAADDCVGQQRMVAAADAAGATCSEAQCIIGMLQVIATQPCNLLASDLTVLYRSKEQQGMLLIYGGYAWVCF
jgi:hypothetical protein